MDDTKQDQIKDYFLIGDLHTAALISKNGSIDWLCLPHFDSPSIFAKMLDPNGGMFKLENAGKAKKIQYINDTAIVNSEFENEDLHVSIHDFMLPQPTTECDTHFVIRKITAYKTSVVKINFAPKAQYATENSLFEMKHVDGKLEGKTENHTLWLHVPSEANVVKQNDGFHLILSINEGETQQLILEFSQTTSSVGNTKEDYETKTESFWKEWVAKGTFFNFYKDRLIRSAITLKLMQFYPTGAIVAAPTMSLPEEIGGVRNWDYRYVWIRDATFTLYALYVLGYTEEAERFFLFIESIAYINDREDAELDIFYTIRGNAVPEEKILEYLSGYKNSRPVRIGNEARNQFQLDVYGSLIDAHYFMTKRGVELSPGTKKIIIDLTRRIKERWHERDNGIWEIRRVRQHYTYSKVMAWVGIDRAIKLCDILGIEKNEKKNLEKLRKNIENWIWKNCYNTKSNEFRQYPETAHQDASTLLFVLMHFLDRHDKKTKAIVLNTCKELLYKELFVYRYKSNDGIDGGEGAFVLCSFWLISAFAMIGELDKAEHIFSLFEKNIASSGLLSEEINPANLEYLGNFPQAFSHVGYIMSAFYINKYSSRQVKNEL